MSDPNEASEQLSSCPGVGLNKSKRSQNPANNRLQVHPSSILRQMNRFRGKVWTKQEQTIANIPNKNQLLQAMMDPDEAVEQPSSSSTQAAPSSTQAAPTQAVPTRRGARVQRRDIFVEKLESGYDSCEKVCPWTYEPGRTSETVKPPELEVLYRDLCYDYPRDRTRWLRALRKLHKDLQNKEIEDAKMARTDAARDKHLADAEAVRVRWQSVVRQVADKCLALPLHYRWCGTPACLQGWYSPETAPPPHLITYARSANDALTKEIEFAIKSEKNRLRFGGDPCYKHFWNDELWALIAQGLGDKCICFHCREQHGVADCPIINEELRRFEEIPIPGVG